MKSEPLKHTLTLLAALLLAPLAALHADELKHRGAKRGRPVKADKRVNCADIWRTQLLTLGGSNDSCIRLYCHNETHDYFDILCHKRSIKGKRFHSFCAPCARR